MRINFRSFTSEHVLKTDIVHTYGKDSYHKLNENNCTLKNDKENKLQGLISDVIKNPKNLCKQCNNILSDSYDRAYDKFIQYVLNYSELILKKRFIDFK